MAIYNIGFEFNFIDVFADFLIDHKKHNGINFIDYQIFVPNKAIGAVPKLVCAIIVAAVEGQALPISSIAITNAKVSIPVPPYFSSQGIPIRPKSAIFLTDSYSEPSQQNAIGLFLKVVQYTYNCDC